MKISSHSLVTLTRVMVQVCVQALWEELVILSIMLWVRQCRAKRYTEAMGLLAAMASNATTKVICSTHFYRPVLFKILMHSAAAVVAPLEQVELEILYLEVECLVITR